LHRLSRQRSEHATDIIAHDVRRVRACEYAMCVHEDASGSHQGEKCLTLMSVPRSDTLLNQGKEESDRDLRFDRSATDSAIPRDSYRSRDSSHLRNSDGRGLRCVKTIRAESLGRNARGFTRARESARRLGAETRRPRFRLGVAGARALSPFYTLARSIRHSASISIAERSVILDITCNHADARERI